jgi:hypothetical protein
MLFKVDADGRQQWSKTYGYTYSEEAFEVQQTSDGGYIIAGGTTSYSLGGWDFWQVKADANGNRQWTQRNGGALDDQAYSVKQTSDGGFILAGSTLSYGEGLADFWLAKSMPPLPRPPENDHDVAVTGVLPSRIVIGEGNLLAINVTTTNLGKYRETPMVFVYANASVIDEPCQIFLEIGQSESFILFWNTSGFTKGVYMISAVADPVPGEEGDALADNRYDDGEVIVTIIGDVQGDLKVTARDLFNLGKAYSSDPFSHNWDMYCDFNQDGAIDLSDLQLLSQNFGRTPS